MLGSNLTQEELGCRFCGTVDFTDACRAADGSCQDPDFAWWLDIKEEDNTEDDQPERHT